MPNVPTFDSPTATRHSSKSILANLLKPLAWLADEPIGAWKRLWSFARLSQMAGRLDPSVVVLGLPEVRGTRNLQIGRNLYLYPGLYLETQDQGRITLGDDVVMSRGVHVVAHVGVWIGRGTMLGEYASIRDANHRASGTDLRNAGHVAQPIIIGNHVWIGRGAVVLAGVTIGDGAVIAANAVVTRDVAPGVTVGGVPAEPLYRRGNKVERA